MRETTRQTEVEIRSILRKLFSDRKVDIEDVERTTPLLPSLGLDSLDAVDLAMELERRFDVQLGELDTYETTVASLAALIDAHRAQD